MLRCCADEGQELIVRPEGCTPLYASPQHLRARQSRLECGSRPKLLQQLSSGWRKVVRCGCAGAHDVKDVDECLVCGMEADVWSAGVVLFEMVCCLCIFQFTMQTTCAMLMFTCVYHVHVKYMASVHQALTGCNTLECMLPPLSPLPPFANALSLNATCLTLFAHPICCLVLTCMHVQMTGELPFEPKDTDEQPVAPAYVPAANAANKADWEECEAILRLQRQYVSHAYQAVTP